MMRGRMTERGARRSIILERLRCTCSWTPWQCR